MSLSPSASSSFSVSFDPSFSTDPSASTDPSNSSSPSSSSSSSSSPSVSLDPSNSPSVSPSPSNSPSSSSSSSNSPSSSPSISPAPSSSSSASVSQDPYVFVEPPRLSQPNSFAPSDFSNGTGIGYSVALKKDVPFDFQFEDRFGNPITNDFDLVNSFVDVSIGFDVLTTGDVFAPSGENFRSGVVSTNYLYTYEQNSGAFGSPQRYYKLKFKLQEDAQTNYNVFTIYHLPAEISDVRVSGYSEGQTGGVTLSVDTPDNGVNFLVRQFNVYTGASTGFNPSTGNLIKNFPIFRTLSTYNLQINQGEQAKGTNCYYKVLPTDDFGTGYFWTGNVSGLLDYPREARTFLEAIPVRGTLEDRTGIFTGYATPSLTSYDGISFFQTGVGQELYVVKSGQWKVVTLA